MTQPAPDRRTRPLLLLGLALLTAIGFGAASLLPARAQDPDQNIRFFRIGTGTTGGTYFPIGGIIANAISNPPGSPPCDKGGSCGVPGLIAVAQASSGSVENIDNIASGAIESGLSQSDVTYWAYTGSGLYEGQEPMEDLRAIAKLYMELVHIVVPADSDIETVADLRGKRVSLGDQGSGTLLDMRLILDAYGLSEEDIQPVYERPEPSAEMMLNGEIDAFGFVGGAPVLAIEDLARRMDIRLLPFTDEATVDLIAERPFFAPARLDGGIYEGVDSLTTIAVGALWVTSAKIETDLIEGVTRALWHPTTGTLLENGHPRGREINLESAVTGVPIPFHDGALRYYEEVGAIGGPDALDPPLE